MRLDCFEKAIVPWQFCDQWRLVQTCIFETTWRMGSQLVSMINNHGDRVRPLRMGLWDPCQMAMNMAYKGVILTTYKSWDDPPSTSPRLEEKEIVAPFPLTTRRNGEKLQLWTSQMQCQMDVQDIGRLFRKGGRKATAMVGFSCMGFHTPPICLFFSFWKSSPLPGCAILQIFVRPFCKNNKISQNAAGPLPLLKQ